MKTFRSNVTYRLQSIIQSINWLDIVCVHSYYFSVISTSEILMHRIVNGSTSIYNLQCVLCLFMFTCKTSYLNVIWWMCLCAKLAYTRPHRSLFIHEYLQTHVEVIWSIQCCCSHPRTHLLYLYKYLLNQRAHRTTNSLLWLLSVPELDFFSDSQIRDHLWIAFVCTFDVLHLVREGKSNSVETQTRTQCNMLKKNFKWAHCSSASMYISFRVCHLHSYKDSPIFDAYS